MQTRNTIYERETDMTRLETVFAVIKDNSEERGGQCSWRAAQVGRKGRKQTFKGLAKWPGRQERKKKNPNNKPPNTTYTHFRCNYKCICLYLVLQIIKVRNEWLLANLTAFKGTRQNQQKLKNISELTWMYKSRGEEKRQAASKPHHQQ